MKEAYLLAVALSLVGCRPDAAPPTAPAPAASLREVPADEAQRRFTELMESNDLHLKSLQEESAAGAGPAVCRARLERIRRNLRQASTCRVKPDAGRQADLSAQFGAALETLDAVDRDPWTDAAAAYRRVEDTCNACHAKFEKD